MQWPSPSPPIAGWQRARYSGLPMLTIGVAGAGPLFDAVTTCVASYAKANDHTLLVWEPLGHSVPLVARSSSTDRAHINGDGDAPRAAPRAKPYIQGAGYVTDVRAFASADIIFLRIADQPELPVNWDGTGQDSTIYCSTCFGSAKEDTSRDSAEYGHRPKSAACQILKVARRGAVIVDQSPISAVTAAHREASGHTAGLKYISSPVVGGVDAARTGRLVQLFSGEQCAQERVRPMVAPLGPVVATTGGAGFATTLQLLGTSAFLGALEALTEVFAAGEAMGIDLRELSQLIGELRK